MKTQHYALAIAIGLAWFAFPSGVQADTIVNVTMSNLTFNGNNACGQSGTALCIQTLNAAFQWDNTTNAFVAGTLSFNTSGPLGTSFVTAFTPQLTGFAGNPVGVGFKSGTNVLDALTMYIGETSNALAPGVYNLTASENNVLPGSWFGGLGCATTVDQFGNPSATTPCGQTFFPFVGSGVLPNSQFGAVASSGVVTVSAVSTPEPPTGALLGTGLLFLMGMTLFRRRVA